MMFNQQSQLNNSKSDFSAPPKATQKQLLSPFQQKLLQAKLQTNLRPEYRR